MVPAQGRLLAAVVYRDAPDFDNPLACGATIVGAYHQVVVGVQQLIELALGRPVTMDGQVRCREDGFHAAVDWSPEED